MDIDFSGIPSGLQLNTVCIFNGTGLYLLMAAEHRKHLSVLDQ